MAGEDDPPWEDEYAEDAPTRLDTDKTVAAVVEAVPIPIEARSTGKYKTLSGYGVSPDVQSELAFGRGCAHCTKKVLMALKLRLIETGTHPDVADAQIEKFRIWMEDPDNVELVRVAMKG